MKAADASILLVEDVASMRTIIRTILRAAGVQRVLQAGDGAEALSILRERALAPDSAPSNAECSPIHLIVCDWLLPRLSGLELLDLVRSDPSLAHIPFIMITAENTREMFVEAAALGVTDYVVKPFQAFELQEKVLAALASWPLRPRRGLGMSGG